MNSELTVSILSFGFLSLCLAEREGAKYKPHNFCWPRSAAGYKERDNFFWNNPTGKSDISTKANRMGMLGFLPLILMLLLVNNWDFALLTLLKKQMSVTLSIEMKRRKGCVVLFLVHYTQRARSFWVLRQWALIYAMLGKLVMNRQNPDV